ncbi:hypothetical protein EMIHUDRAFT_228494 [Emiliania huxleyi CCMP1516]|uniref:Uncharacterized protein n=2 Tax=Emiliania huxleyi TaxID=2903 RepID=A0A0D3KFJ6_EMIH1|nr:hypothetical protein EMIHUDRAFT_228494 [Emiliania huxleyi CCMP1516]EOD34531.1 hypothetical protein EMIHUDRAFT_228494 [Emiliania huxleyi CCMP1516]|eukprot:XP_005786960.1 hypothetical protein EMIHUDRAFT_228494 [Emiliania huxleyi CCMP1516]
MVQATLQPATCKKAAKLGHDAVSSERLVEPVVEGKPVPSSRGDTTVYRRLRNRYLVAYSLATFGDWIQGGYLYALYIGHFRYLLHSDTA